MVATIEILPEINLTDVLYYPRSSSLDRYRALPPAVMGQICDNEHAMQTRKWKKQYQFSCSVWPAWVYQSYDLQLLGELVRQELRKSVYVHESSCGAALPRDPIDLSYWVIKNLTLEDEQRLLLLSINNPNQRLRAELSILRQVEQICSN